MNTETNLYFWSHLAQFFLEWKICRENRNTHFKFNNYIFWKSRRLWDNVDMMYLLIATGVTPGCSSTVHIYTQTVHRTNQSTQTIRRTTQLTIARQLTIVETNRPQITVCSMLFACWITKATNTQTHTCNIYCFSTATKVAQTRLTVTFYVHCLSCLAMSAWSCGHVSKLCEFTDLQRKRGSTVQTGYCTQIFKGYWGLLPGEKQSGRGIVHPLPSSVEVRQRGEVHLYSPCGHWWRVIEWTYMYCTRK